MKKWLITGASSGFGRLLAERVASDGDHVIAVARREDRLRELAAEHDSVTPLAVDLTAPDVEQRLRTAIDVVGGLDILVNDAGYGLFAPVEQTPDGEARAVFDTNFFCSLGGTQGSTTEFAKESRKGVTAFVDARRSCLPRFGCLLRQ
jgi:NAD(P)-dependent dehydrogenase (short-subunit alcohol dehydrogenase family)